MTAEPERQVESVAEAEDQIADRVKIIERTRSRIEEIAADSQAELQGKSEDELSSAENAFKEKAQELIEAAEKIEDEIAEIVQSDTEPTEKISKLNELELSLLARVKEHTLLNINRLQDEQTAVTDRFNTVVTALKEKGGDVEEYEKYAAAISGPSLDVEDIQDVSAFKIIVMGWLKSTDGGLRWLKNILFFIITLPVFYALAGVAGRIVHRAVSASKKCSDLLGQFFVNVTRKAVMLIGAIVALSMLEINIAPFIAGLGVAGFILGFALQGTLSNFASGLMILIYRPFDVGHLVEIKGVTGVVASMNLVSTTITTLDNKIVVVPNGQVWQGVITNITGSDTRRVDMVFGISYSDESSKAST